MNIWEFIDKQLDRPGNALGAIDARGWIGMGVYILVVMVMLVYFYVPDLRTDDYFQSLSTLIIGTAFINSIVPWAFGSTKTGGEIAKSAQEQVVQSANANQTSGGSDPKQPGGLPKPNARVDTKTTTSTTVTKLPTPFDPASAYVKGDEVSDPHDAEQSFRALVAADAGSDLSDPTIWERLPRHSADGSTG